MSIFFNRLHPGPRMERRLLRTELAPFGSFLFSYKVPCRGTHTLRIPIDCSRQALGTHNGGAMFSTTLTNPGINELR